MLYDTAEGRAKVTETIIYAKFDKYGRIVWDHETFKSMLTWAMANTDPGEAGVFDEDGFDEELADEGLRRAA